MQKGTGDEVQRRRVWIRGPQARDGTAQAGAAGCGDDLAAETESRGRQQDGVLRDKKYIRSLRDQESGGKPGRSEKYIRSQGSLGGEGRSPDREFIRREAGRSRPL